MQLEIVWTGKTAGPDGFPVLAGGGTTAEFALELAGGSTTEAGAFEGELAEAVLPG